MSNSIPPPSLVDDDDIDNNGAFDSRKNFNITNVFKKQKTEVNVTVIDMDKELNTKVDPHILTTFRFKYNPKMVQNRIQTLHEDILSS